MEKTYIGEVEALEIAVERGIMELPLKGKECMTVLSIHEAQARTMHDVSILGKDEKGFYVA
jgi:hypothetical protein